MCAAAMECVMYWRCRDVENCAGWHCCVVTAQCDVGTGSMRVGGECRKSGYLLLFVDGLGLRLCKVLNL